MGAALRLFAEKVKVFTLSWVPVAGHLEGFKAPGTGEAPRNANLLRPQEPGSCGEQGR